MSAYFAGVSFEFLTALIICTAVSLFYLFYWLLTKNYSYWKDRQVPYIEPSLFFGSIKEQCLRKNSHKYFINKVYDTFKNNGYGGAFFLNTPVLYVCKPELIQKVLVEDFNHFHDRLSKGHCRYLLTNNLSNSTGERWRALRSQVAQAFSPEKVSGMFQQIICSTDRVLRLLSDLTDCGEPIEIENMTTAFTTEVLASCMFGIEVSNVDQYQQLEESLDAIFNPSLIRYIVTMLGLVNLKLYNLLKLQRIPKKAMDALAYLIREITTYRKQNEVKRDDVLQTILDLKSQEENCRDNYENTSYENIDDSRDQKGMPSGLARENTFTETCISSMMFNFMTGGIKPASVTITFALYEIAKSPTIQDTLRKEISEAISKNGGWSCKALGDMCYLDLVVQETLRLYSFNLLLVRSVTEPNTLPGTSVTLEKNMIVLIPVDGLHRDPEFYPSPEEFRPERWENNRYRASSVYLPFGHGPRACLSIDLAVLMIKLCLARVLTEYRVSVGPRMKAPLVMDEMVFYPKVKGGMWLSFTKSEEAQ